MRTTAAVSCLQRAPRVHNIVRGSQQLSALRTWLENLFGMTASSLSARAEVYPWQLLCMCRHGVSTDISRYKVAMCPGLVTRDT